MSRQVHLPPAGEIHEAMAKTFIILLHIIFHSFLILHLAATSMRTSYPISIKQQFSIMFVY